MAYRISYAGRRQRNGLLVQQAVVAVVIWVSVLLSGSEVRNAFASGPDPAQKALAEAYAQGEGLHRSMVIFCREVLEQAGYEIENIR